MSKVRWPQWRTFVGSWFRFDGTLLGTGAKGYFCELGSCSCARP